MFEWILRPWIDVRYGDTIFKLGHVAEGKVEPGFAEPSLSLIESTKQSRKVHLGS